MRTMSGMNVEGCLSDCRDFTGGTRNGFLWMYETQWALLLAARTQSVKTINGTDTQTEASHLRMRDPLRDEALN